MASSGTISSKGQVTVPIDIRDRLGLGSGDRVEFVLEDGRVYLRPVRPAENKFASYVGALPAFSSLDEIKSFTSSLRDDESVPDESSEETKP